MIVQAFELLFLGMGSVFAFLALLVLVMSAMAVVLQRFAPASPDDAPMSPLLSENMDSDAEILAVAIATARDASNRHVSGC